MKKLILCFGLILSFSCVHVFAWATFEICEAVSTVARGASVIITSPGYLGTSKPGTSGAQMCECIIQSADKADMYLDYLQTQLASEGKHCPYEYVLLESKKNITQTENDDQLEVCGQKHVKGRWFAGTLRLTYASGGPMEQRGLLSKFTVDNLGNSPRIQLECGKVNSNGVKLQQRPKPDGNGNTQSISGSIPASVGFPPMGMPPWAMNFGNNNNDNNNNNLNMGMPMFPPFPPMNPMFPEPPPSGRPPPAPRHEKPPPDFSKWNIKVNNEETPKEATGIVNFANAVFKTPAPNKPTPKANPPRRGSNPTRAGTPNKKNGAGKVMGDGSDPAVSDEKAVDRKKNASGGMVALVFGGIGSVLIIGSVGILLIHNQRKKRRRMRKQEEYASAGSASMTYGKGWDTKSVESVYATVADVDPHNHGCINPAISNDDFSMGMSNKTAVEGEDEDPSSIFGKCSDFGTYDRISLKENKEILNPVQEIAVVEVHHVHEGHEVKVKLDEPEHSHGDGCVYAKSSKFQGENRCGECKIERPPRRKDKDNGYDNNFGVKRHQQ